jgi:diadenosine tetraphosphate (Ap4A) HIT family hydrolase
MHESSLVQNFIQQEIGKPSKVWVQEVVNEKRECEFVKLRTPEFVLLPDSNAQRRQCKSIQSKESIDYRYMTRATSPFMKTRWQTQYMNKKHELHQNSIGRQPGFCAQRKSILAITEDKTEYQKIEAQTKGFNWLAIVADPKLRSIRDLRGEHVDMLENLYEQCIKAIKKDFQIESHDVMVFANYPPSVYKLHFHFCAPFFMSGAYDAFRMHSLSNIINNLKVCSDYYKLSSFQIPVHVSSELFSADIIQSDVSKDKDEPLKLKTI